MSKATKVVVPIVLLGALIGLGTGAYFAANKFLGGGSGGQYFNEIADMAPEDAVAVIAVRNLEEAFTYATAEFDDDLREAAEEELNVDIFDPDTFREWGFDFARPSGAMILGLDPMSIVLVVPTIEGGEEQRDNLAEILEDVFEADDEDFDTDEVEDVPCIIADEFVMAFRDDHALVFIMDLPYGTDDPRDELADAMADLLEYDDETFSAQAGVANAVAFDGQTIAIVAGAFEQLAPLLEEFELDELAPGLTEQLSVVALGLATDSSGLTLTARAPIEDAEMLEVMTEAPDFGSAFEHIPGPVELGMRMRFNVELAVERALEQLSEAPEFEEQFEEAMDAVSDEADIDVMDDLIPLLTGELGFIVQTIPPSDDPTRTRVTVFIGVNDEDEIHELLETLSESAPPGVVEIEETDSGDVYVLPMGPRGALGVHDGYIWVTVDDEVLMDMIDGDIDSFLEEDDDEGAVAFFEQNAHLALYLPIAGGIRDALLASEPDDEFTVEFFESLDLVTFQNTVDGNVAVASLNVQLDTEAAFGAVLGAFEDGMRASMMGGDSDSTEIEPTNGMPNGANNGMNNGANNGANNGTNNGANNGMPNGGTDPNLAQQNAANMAATVEARVGLSQIAAGAITHYVRNRAFPASTQPTPSMSVLNVACATGGAMTLNPGQWNSGTWSELGFSPESQHRYVYQFETNGAGNKAAFTASAFGDLDCDGSFSTFRQFGAANSAGGVDLGEMEESRPTE